MTPTDDPQGPESEREPDAGAAVPEAGPLDELASAIVDGEATPEEQARATEREVAARVAEFRNVAGHLAAPVAPAADPDRERAIEAALAASPAAAATDPDAAAPVPMPASKLAVHRARADRQRTRLRVLGAAAAVVAAIAVGAVALQGGGDDDDTAAVAPGTATAEGEAADPSASAADDSADGAARTEAGADTEGLPAAPLAGDAAHLGSFDDLDDLVAAAASSTFEQAAAGSAGATAGAGSSDSDPRYTTEFGADACPGAEAGSGERRIATAVLDGRPVIVFVHTDPDDGEVDEDEVRVVVRDAETCAVLADRTP